jgi:magnesium transporter
MQAESSDVKFVEGRPQGSPHFSEESGKMELLLRLHTLDERFQSHPVLIQWDGEEMEVIAPIPLEVRGATPGEIAWNLLQSEMDLLNALEVRVDGLQNRAIMSYSQDLVREVLAYRAMLLQLNRDYMAMRNALEAMYDAGVDKKNARRCIRDLNEMMESVAFLREGTATAVQLMQNTLAAKMNEVMKVLTIIATLMMPLTLITGIYGMNFRYMPEIYWEYGYAYSLLLMLSVAIVMLVYFRKKGLL